MGENAVLYPKPALTAHAQNLRSAPYNMSYLFRAKRDFYSRVPMRAYGFVNFQNVAFDYTSTMQRVSSSVCLFLIRFTIPTQAGNALHHHIILKLKLPYFPLSRPQITLAFACFHLYCALSNSKINLIISLIQHNRLR